MWHHVGLTLLVFVATLLIVLLLMVCGEWGRPPWSGSARALGSGRWLAGAVWSGSLPRLPAPGMD